MRVLVTNEVNGPSWVFLHPEDEELIKGKRVPINVGGIATSTIRSFCYANSFETELIEECSSGPLGQECKYLLGYFRHELEKWLMLQIRVPKEERKGSMWIRVREERHKEFVSLYEHFVRTLSSKQE